MRAAIPFNKINYHKLLANINELESISSTRMKLATNAMSMNKKKIEIS